MGLKCSIVSTIGESNLPSRIFTAIENPNFKSILSDDILTLINKEFGSVREFAVYIFKQTQTNDEIKALPVFYEETEEPSLQSVLSVLIKSETNSNIKAIYSFLKADKTYDPSIYFNNTFTPTDVNHSNLQLGKLYFDLLLNKRLSEEEKRLLKNGDNNLKLIMVKYLQEDIEKAKEIKILSQSNEDYIKSYFIDLLNPNSYLWDEFTSYLNSTYGINLLEFESNPFNSEFFEEFEFDSENITVSWNDTVNERIDRKKTITSKVKIQLALLLNDIGSSNTTSNKLYLDEPTDINKLWNKLIHLHINDITTEDVLKTLDKISTVIPSFHKIINYINGENGISQEDANVFKAAYVNSIKLAVIPVDFLLMENQNGSLTVTNITANQDSFGDRVFSNKFRTAIESGIESELYNLSKLKSSKITSNQLNLNKVITDILSAAKALNFGISRSALETYFSQYENQTNDVKVRRYNDVIESINYILSDVIDLIENPNPSVNFDEFGNLNLLASIAAHDFNTPIRLTYQDTKGQLNYSPQNDSFLTKMFRGLKVRGQTNETYIHELFDKYLNDETLALDNLLHWDERLKIGLFDENGNIVKSYLNELNLFQFEGLKLNGLGFKYRNLQSSAYTFVEIVHNLLGNYIFLTSDSPRSYGITVRQLETDTLYNKDGSINNESPMYIALSKIVQSQINEFNKAGDILFKLNDSEASKYHNLKYSKNGKILENGIPVGRQFKFLDITYVENQKSITLIDYVAQEWGVTAEEVYKDLVKSSQEGILSQYQLDNYIYGFLTNYIKWSRNSIESEYGNIKEILLKVSRGKEQLIKIADKDSGFNERVRQEYNKIIEEQQKANIELTEEKLNQIEKEAFDRILRDTDITKLESFKDAILKVLLNHTVHSVGFNNLINGKLGEYKDTIDYNKRISQIIKNGYNSLQDDTTRRILVIEDIKLKSNIQDKLFKDLNENVKNSLSGTINTTDAMSIMTDEALERFLKSNGRWGEFKEVFTALRDDTIPFNPNQYNKLIEQLKLFGTARRNRGELVNIPETDEYFKNQIETIQIKDSTIILFKNFEKGKQTELLYDWMILNGIDQVSPVSAVKVSGVTPLRIHDENGNFVAPTQLDSRHILNMYQSDFVIQQDIPADILDKHIVFGNQLLKQIVQGLNWTQPIYKVGNKQLTGEELFKDLQDTLSANIKADALQLYNELGALDEYGNIKLTPNGQIAINESVLVEMLQESVQSDNSNANLKDILNLDNNGLTLFPLSSPMIYKRLEKIITSRIYKQVTHLILPGIHAPLRADIFNNNKSDLSKLIKEQSSEDFNKTIDEVLDDTTITYTDEFIDSIKKGDRTFQLQAGHTYIDGQQVQYAEILINPWNKSFYDNIGTTKQLSNGKEIIIVDINKISKEARRGLAIRIPTEGKQSMIVFEVVGFLNSGTTQAIFPYTLIQQTGWDFDIDTIYAYFKHLTTDKYNNYIPIDFDAVQSTKKGQRLPKFYDQIITQYIKGINLNEDTDKLNYATKESHYAEPSEVVTRYDHRVLFPLLDIFDSDHEVNNFDNIKIQINNLLQLKVSKDLQFKFKRLDRIVNRFIPNSLSEIRIKTAQLLSYLDYDTNLTDAIEDLSNAIKFTEEEKITIYSRYSRNYNKKRFDYYASLPNSINKDIHNIENLLIQIKESIEEILSGEPVANDIQLALSNINIDSLFKDSENSNFAPFEELETIAESIEQQKESYVKKFLNSPSLLPYDLKTREQRDNHIIDLMTAVLTNKEHINETTKPNETYHITKSSALINELYDYTIDTFNPNNLSDKIKLNNISMGSRDLKGHSVSNDNIASMLSTLHANLQKGFIYPIDIEQFPLIDGKPLQIKNGKLSDSKQIAYLVDRLGLDKKDNLVIKIRGTKLLVENKYINNDAINTGLDISGEKTSYQLSESTAAILDILKSNLSRNLNMQTIGVFRLLSMGTMTERYYDGTTTLNEVNRYSYATAFINQPVLIELIEDVNVRKLTDNNTYEPNLIHNASKSLANKYYRELFETFKQLPIYKQLSNYDTLNKQYENRKRNFYINKETLAEIKKLSGTTIDFTSKEQNYYSTKELIDFIKNRNSNNIIYKIGYLISQLEILKAFDVYNDIAHKVTSIMFNFRTEDAIDTFTKADKFENTLADSYITKEEFRKLLTKRQQESFAQIEKRVFPNISSEQEKANIRNRFNRLTTYYNSNVEGFLEQNPDTKQYYIAGYPQYTIDIHNFITKFDAINEINNFSLLQTRQQRSKKISLLKIDYTPTAEFLVDNKTVIDLVYTGNEKGYINPNEDGSGNIINNSQTSIYGLVQARYQFGNWFAVKGFGSVFAQRSYVVKTFVNKYLIDNGKQYDAKTKAFLESHLIEYLAQKEKRSITDSVSSIDLRRVLGNQTKKERDTSNQIIKSIKNNLITDGDINIESFEKFTKLSLREKIQLLTSDETILKYLNLPEFKNSNIFLHLEFSTTFRNKNGYDRITIDSDDVNTMEFNDISSSIIAMWNSKNPYIANTIRDMIMYAYYVNGFQYGYNVSKYIHPSLLVNDEINQDYIDFISKLGIADITEDISNYGTNLRIASNKLINSNIEELESIEDNYIVESFDYICRQNPSINPYLPLRYKQVEIFNESLQLATFGYLPNIDGEERGSFPIKFGDKLYDVIIETKDRVDNSIYPNTRYFSKRGLIYKRSDIIMEEGIPLYVYYPVSKLLQNEYAEHSIIEKLNIPTDITEHYIGEEEEPYMPIEPLNIENYIQEAGYTQLFLTTLFELSNQRNESIDSLDLSLELYDNNSLDELAQREEDQWDQSEEDSTSPTIESETLNRSSVIEGLTGNIELIESSLSTFVKNIDTEHDSVIYIGHTDNTRNNIYKVNSNKLQLVDYTKSPIEEANRLSKDLKIGSIYIDGDTLLDSKVSQEYSNYWTGKFISQLLKIKGGITNISTLANEGFGFSVNKTFTNTKTKTYALKDKDRYLRSSIVKITRPELIGIETKTTQGSKLALNGYDKIKLLIRELSIENIPNSDKIKQLYYEFKNEYGEETLLESLKEHDFEVLELSLDKISKINGLVLNTVDTLLKELNDVDFDSIKIDDAKLQDYKDKIRLITRLIGIPLSYEQISPYTYEDAGFKEIENEELENFESLYGEINDKIYNIQNHYKSAKEYKNAIFKKIEMILVENVFSDSRNPNYTTAFSKIKSNLIETDFDVDALESAKLEITKSEYEEILELLFDLNNKDINKAQSWLDSAAHTGITLLDVTIKQYAKAKDKNIQSIRSVMSTLESAIEKVDPKFLKDRSLLSNWFKKFVTEQGDLIDDYDKGTVLRHIEKLQIELNDIITELYRNVNSEIIGEQAIKKTIIEIKSKIEDFNNRGLGKLTRLSKEELDKYNEDVRDKTDKERQSYDKLNGYIQLKYMSLTSNPYNAIFKIEYSEKSKNTTYNKLSDVEKEFLTTLKATIQKVLFDYDTNFVPYNNTFTNLLPFVATVTMNNELRRLTHIPKAHTDDTYTDLDGKEKYRLIPTTLTNPTFYKEFKIRPIFSNEDLDKYKASIVQQFKTWYVNQKEVLPIDISHINSLQAIEGFNEISKEENLIEKKRRMSFDILDIMKIFTNQLYQIKAVKDFQTDFDLNQYAMDDVNAKDVIPRALESHNKFIDRVYNVSKHRNAVDVAAAAITRYSSMTFMWGNFTAGFKNVIKGITDMIIESNANNFIDSKSLRQGLTEMIKILPRYMYEMKNEKSNNITLALIKDFDEIYQDTTDHKTTMSGSEALVKLFSQADAFGYLPNNTGEYLMQFAMLIAATKSHRVAGGRIWAFNDFYNDTREKAIIPLFTDKQKKQYNQFKSKYDEQLKKQENNKKKESGFNGDYLGEFLRIHWNEFTIEQRKELNVINKENKEKYKTLFEKLPTLESQLELKDGFLSWKPESGLTRRAMTEFRDRVKGINQSLHGIYNRLDRNVLQDQAFGDLWLQFRKWMRPNYVRHFGRKWMKASFNETTGAWEIPIYKPVWDWFSMGKKAYKQELSEQEYEDSIKWTPHAIGKVLLYQLSALKKLKFYYNTLSIEEQASTIKWIKHNATVIFLGASALLMGKLKDDDDEDSELYTHAMYILYSSYHEVIEPIPIYGWSAVIKQSLQRPFVGESVIEAAISLTTLTMKSIVSGNDELIYDRGIYKGQDKRNVVLGKMIPIYRQIEKSRNLQSSMNWYKWYNPFL